MLHTEDYTTHFNSKVRTFSGVEVIAAAPHKSKGIYWDQVKVKGAESGDWEMEGNSFTIAAFCGRVLTNVAAQVCVCLSEGSNKTFSWSLLQSPPRLLFTSDT